MKFSIIYADPPWDYGENRTQYGGKALKPSGSAAEHYSVMEVSDLARLDVPSITETDALLFMWTSSPHLDQAIELMKAWHFGYVTVGFVWDKQRVNPGYYTMSQCELCLIGKTGKIPLPRGARNVRQFLSAPRGQHSAKPEEIRNRIEQMFPTQRKIELFARTRTQGWSVWGNEVESDIELTQRGNE